MRGRELPNGKWESARRGLSLQVEEREAVALVEFYLGGGEG